MCKTEPSLSTGHRYQASKAAQFRNTERAEPIVLHIGKEYQHHDGVELVHGKDNFIMYQSEKWIF